ncbi:hypothetical protein BYT27DRAFT_6462320 [Phlegmacium glaucopus]|nr:hypothetical protein BYT27DRAFT_6462320 [Phlegmacium glaucopus]
MTKRFCTSPQSSITLNDVDISESGISESWFQDHVENDSLWKDYVEKAEKFDERIIDDWNKIVDVILVYVALFIAVLTSFVIETSKNFTRDPADISNDILVTMYKLQVAQASDNTSFNPPDPNTFFTQNEADYNRAVLCNALLFSALALSTVVSVIALAAKLWLVSYSHRAFESVGSHHERAMKRQEAYNGVLAWRMGAVINLMPLILLVALIMFGFFVHTWVTTLHAGIGYAVAVILAVGFITLAITSFAAAFIPACPFHSSFSTIIQLVFESPDILLKALSNKFDIPEWMKEMNPGRRWLPIVGLVLWFGSGSAIAYGTLKFSGGIMVLVCIPLAITFAYSMQEEETKSRESQKDPRRRSFRFQHETKRRIPQKYRLPLFSLGNFVVIGSLLSTAGYFNHSWTIFITLYTIGMVLLLLFGIIARPLAKSTKETREIDAIAWLLNSTSSDSRSLFMKAGKITSSSGDAKGGVRGGVRGGEYKPRLLASLMPLLSSLITSPRTDTQAKLHEDSEPTDLEVYVSCLAQLSDFEKYTGSWRLLHEDGKRHPGLEQQLVTKLVWLATNPLALEQCGENVKNAAIMVLRNHRLDEHGKEKKQHKRQASGDAGSTITFPEAAHSYYYEEPVELYSRGNGGYSRVDTV